MADIRDALMVARNSEGRLVHRPLSPHLQAYRPQITSVLSIFHRITGVANAVGTVLMVWWLVAAALGERPYAAVQGFIASPIGLLLLFGWTLSLCYHFFAGIRHLAWDAGYGFEKPVYHQTGYAVLIAAAAATVLIWVAGLMVWLSR
jgi:succinate dehydrogenase / fumarate reductase, cytochrome b subunit